MIGSLYCCIRGIRDNSPSVLIIHATSFYRKMEELRPFIKDGSVIILSIDFFDDLSLLI